MKNLLVFALRPKAVRCAKNIVHEITWQENAVNDQDSDTLTRKIKDTKENLSTENCNYRARIRKKEESQRNWDWQEEEEWQSLELRWECFTIYF